MSRSLLAAACLVASMTVPAAKADDRYRVDDEGTIGDRWAFADGTRPQAAGYPAEFVQRRGDVCIALGYRIGPDGTTSDFLLLDQWNSLTGRKEPAPGFWDAFARAVAMAVAEWRFAPKAGVQPVTTFTSVTVGFRGSGADLADIRDACVVRDLAKHIDEMERKRKRVEGTRLEYSYWFQERWTNAQLTRTIPSAPIDGREPGK